MQEWEYKVVFSKDEEQEMNALGKEGWELIAVAGHYGNSIKLYFKRPLN
jgi:hypothetical protein